MALMFQRLARNFVKNGYFPTDEVTIERTLNAIAPSDRPMRVLDPCCGEGTALAEVAHHLGSNIQVESFGIEYNEERAYHAKQLLRRCIHADLMDAHVQPRQFGLLWLNPPYGDLVSDQVSASVSRWKGRKRFEKLFYERTIGALQFGGVLVLIVPHYALDREFATWVARHCSSVQVFRAATDQFKQVVILARRTPVSTGHDREALDLLTQVGTGDIVPPVLPEVWSGDQYTVPGAPVGEPKFFTLRVDAKQLEDEVGHPGGSLWPRFGLTFHSGARAHRRPLRRLSRWHLALALSAGQISGLVRSGDGRTFLLRGDTHKEKAISVETEVNESTGQISETRIHLDRFVPVIRAIDCTPCTDSYGQIFTIR